jgi:hypothetical protein
MIDIEDALGALPHYDTFCSVAELHALAETLRDDPRFTVEVAGTSENGAPIHHVRFGSGAIKAMFVGFVHCSEPIGGLTVHGLMSLLQAGHPALVDADVEWHIVPCIDPDGAVLNEGWSQQPFTLESYLKGFHTQELADQADMSFPIQYKTLTFDAPIPEAVVLKGLIDRVMPDFYFSLHNALAGGAFYFLTHDIGRDRYQAFYDLLATSGLPLEANIYHSAMCKTFGDAVLEMPSMRAFYDFYERAGAAPETLMSFGETSGGYLVDLKPEAQVLVVELPYLKHPITQSQKDTGEDLRRLKLRLDADNKYIATVVLEEWDATKDDLDTASAFYRKVAQSTIQSRDQLHEGLSASPEKTRDLLYNPSYARTMTESERFTQHVMRLYMLSHVYEFVRLLRISRQTDRVRQAIARLDAIFDDVLADIARNLDAERLEVVDCDTLARIQLGTGLITINAMLEDRAVAIQPNPETAG